jgi:hypothetical protein
MPILPASCVLLRVSCNRCIPAAQATCRACKTRTQPATFTICSALRSVLM